MAKLQSTPEEKSRYWEQKGKPRSKYPTQRHWSVEEWAKRDRSQPPVHEQAYDNYTGQMLLPGIRHGMSSQPVLAPETFTGGHGTGWMGPEETE